MSLRDNIGTEEYSGNKEPNRPSFKYDEFRIDKQNKLGVAVRGDGVFFAVLPTNSPYLKDVNEFLDCTNYVERTTLNTLHLSSTFIGVVVTTKSKEDLLEFLEIVIHLYGGESELYEEVEEFIERNYKVC